MTMTLRFWLRSQGFDPVVEVLTSKSKFVLDVEVLTLLLRCWPCCWCWLRRWGFELDVEVLTLMLRCWLRRWCIDLEVEVLISMLKCWLRWVGVCRGLSIGTRGRPLVFFCFLFFYFFNFIFLLRNLVLFLFLNFIIFIEVPCFIFVFFHAYMTGVLRRYLGVGVWRSSKGVRRSSRGVRRSSRGDWRSFEGGFKPLFKVEIHFRQVGHHVECTYTMSSPNIDVEA